MKWHNIYKEPLPKTDKDIDLLIQSSDIPMQYIAITWDGKDAWMFSRFEDAPWITLPEWVKISEWAFIDENEEKEYNKNGRL